MNSYAPPVDAPSWMPRHGSARWIEAHNGLSAHIGSSCSIGTGLDGGPGFDALWVSSLTTSAASFLPDAELHLLDNRMDLTLQICEASSKPVVLDGDTGGEVLAFQHLVRRLERIGVAAVCIEDKRVPKRNSFSTQVCALEDAGQFAAKIQAGVQARRRHGPRIIARLESLIAGNGVEDAIDRARLYTQAGADAILIHSIHDASELFAFADRVAHTADDRLRRLPLICVPTAYPGLAADQLFDAGFNVVVYANHLLRASVTAMRETARRLLIDGGPVHCEAKIEPVRDLLALHERHCATPIEAARRRSTIASKRSRSKTGRRLKPTSTKQRSK